MLQLLPPDSFEDSQLEEIPKGWIVGELGEIAHIVMGQSPPGETYNELLGEIRVKEAEKIVEAVA